MRVDIFGTHTLPTQERIELLNAVTRTGLAYLLVCGTLYALVKELLDGNTFLQMASMAVGFYLARATTTSPPGPPAATTVSTTEHGATATVSTGGAATPPPTEPRRD